MLPKILDVFARREAAVLPETQAPPAVPEIAVEDSSSRLAAIRETIDLIETDLAAMIRDGRPAADAVRGGTRKTSDVLKTIRGHSESLTALTGQATENAAHLAGATEEF